jgi:hypothetical protein
MSVTAWIELLANGATAIGVVFAAYQLLQAKRQAQLQFEDSLNSQYRALLTDLPLAAMLGKPLSDADLEKWLPVFYRYFDLSNEQAYLHRRGRISHAAWSTWEEGIQQNLARAAFSQAWARLLPDLDGSFDDLKPLAQKQVPNRLRRAG